MKLVSTWVVEVRYDDEDPGVYGPYTERQARAVEVKLDGEVHLASDGVGGNHHPHSVLGATAWPLSRYDLFLTTEERRRVRNEVRGASKVTDE